jgi:hypothetical protein
MKIIKQMSNNELNHYFTINYENIAGYGTRAIKHFRRKLDITWVMSECYLHLYNSHNQLKDENDVIGWSKNWIKTNLQWKTTPIVRASQINNNTDDFTFMIESNSYINEDDILCKIETFRDTLSTYDRRLFNIWWDLDLRKGKEISEYLDISFTGAYRIIKECKDLDFRLENFIRKNII